MSSVLFFSKVQKGPSLLDLMSLQYVGNWSIGRKPAVFGRAYVQKCSFLIRQNFKLVAKWQGTYFEPLFSIANCSHV